MQWSQVCCTFSFLQNLGHHSLCMKLLRCGLAIRVFTSKTTLPKIWNLRNLFHNWRRLVKYPRLALEEVNVTFITMYCRYKQRTNFFSSDTNRDLASIKNHIRNASGSQVTQSLIVMQIIDLLKTRPVDRVDSVIGSHPM